MTLPDPPTASAAADARRAVLATGPALANPDAAEQCRCACHPRPADPGLHDGGTRCPCQLSDAERRRQVTESLAALAALRADIADDEGRYRQQVAAAAASAGASAELRAPAAPFVVTGKVDGYSFYLRERHEMWQLVVAGDDDPSAPVWDADAPNPVTVAEGSSWNWDWSSTGMVTAAVNMVRDYVRSRHCPHAQARRFCPDCGVRLDDAVTL